MRGKVHLSLALAVSTCALAAAPASAAAPGDPLFDQQWALAHESVLGTAAAWRQSTGQGALVAVLDTGVDESHPDMRGALWTNPGEIAGNGIDDDRDGYVDDVHGADVVNHDGDPADDEGHGTHVAGIIAARAGNGIGGAGLAPDARLMVVKVLDDHRSGTATQLATGIRYALDHGARIINTSVNGEGVSGPLQDALRAADAAGALVVASAGNDGRDIDALPSYPAAYPNASVVSVAALGEDGALTDISNRGLLAVDLAAPGDQILSTAWKGEYELRSGTSMAAPFVSATLALMQAARPDLGGAELKADLLAGTRRPGLLAGLLGTGALDASGALRAELGPDWKGSSAPLELVPLEARIARGGAVLRWTLAGDGAGARTARITLDGRLVDERPAATASRLRVRARPGLHRWTVTVFDAAGDPLAHGGGSFRVPRAG